MPGAAVPKLPNLPPWGGLHYAGLDENGMGPRLGPLIVTSVLARASTIEKARIATGKPRGELGKRINDSKKLVSFEDSRLGEAWARAIVTRTQGRADAGARLLAPPLTPTDLLASLSVEGATSLRADCPDHHADLCWGDEGETFAADDDAVAACARDLEALAKRGLDVLRVRVAIVCTRRLNDAVDRGLSRFDVDLHTMEKLALAAREDAGEDVYALCGKVGGLTFYGDRFGPLAGRLYTTLDEQARRSVYQLPGVGRLAFVMDADAHHLIVGLASLVGKWVRDHLMRRVVTWHRVRSPEGASVPAVSGYHDPNTTRFVESTRLVRKTARVEPQCFERTSLGLVAKQKEEAAAKASSAPKRERRA